MQRNDKYWFPAKRYGWGWGRPLTWHGWLVYLGFIGVVVWYFVWANNRILMGETAGLSDNTFLVVGFCLVMVILLPVLVMVCLLKGESPKWRWGNKK